MSTPELGGIEQERGAAVFFGVVRCVLGPAFPQDAKPGAREDAHGMGMIAATCTSGGVDLRGPGRRVAGVAGPRGDGAAQAMVAGPAEADAARFAALVGHGRNARLGGQLLLGEEAFAHVAELGEDLRRVGASGAREAHEDVTVGQLCDFVFDARGELGDLHYERGQHAYQGTHEVAFGVLFQLAGRARGGLPEALQQFDGGSPAAVLLTREEAGEAFFPQVCGALGHRDSVGGREAMAESDIDGRRPGPEALEQGAQLIGERDTLGDQVIAGAHQRSQRLDRIPRGRQAAEPMCVGA